MEIRFILCVQGYLMEIVTCRVLNHRQRVSVVRVSHWPNHLSLATIFRSWAALFHDIFFIYVPRKRGNVFNLTNLEIFHPVGKRDRKIFGLQKILIMIKSSRWLVCHALRCFFINYSKILTFIPFVQMCRLL